MRPTTFKLSALLLASGLISISCLGVWVYLRGPYSQPGVQPHTEVAEGLLRPPSRERFLPAWKFANFVAGRTNAPVFARTVTVVVDGETHVVTAAQARQSLTWRGSPLDLYAQSRKYARQEDGKDIPATLTMHVDDGHDFACGGRELSLPYSDRRSLWLNLEPGANGVAFECTMLNVFRNNGRIDALVARTSATRGPGAAS